MLQTTYYQIAKEVVHILQECGFIAYFAGGWVRDFLLQLPSDDIDIATNAPILSVQKIFPKTIPVGLSFGIVVVIYKNQRFEIATFRQDSDYLDGRHPISTQPTSPKEDAKRRDFTINGMFYDPIREKLYDYVGGQRDLQAKIIRAIGDPSQRFREDRLRMIRAVRYAISLQFSIEKETFAAIYHRSYSLFPALAMERVQQELQKMATTPHLTQALLLLHRLKLLQEIFPTLKELPLQTLEKYLSALPHFPKESPFMGKLLELFPSYSLPQKLALCDYLKLSNRDKQFVLFWDRATTLLLQEREDPEHLYELVQWYADPFAPICLQMMRAKLPSSEQESFVKRHHALQEQLHKAIERRRERRFLLPAKALIAEGIPPSPKLGKLLITGEKLAIANSLDNPQQLLQKLKREPLWSA